LDQLSSFLSPFCLLWGYFPALKKLDCSDNKITKGFPKAWENLRQKCTVAYGDQSSFKSREVRERPSDKEAETQSSPKGGKKGTNTWSDCFTAVRLAQGISQDVIVFAFRFMFGLYLCLS
jgi:hypothetical protein